MNNYLNSFKLEEVLLGAILFSLSITINTNSFVVIIITTFFLYKTIIKGNFKGLTLYITSFAFFLAQFISFILSNNKQEAGTKLLLYASFVLFPICFSYPTSKKIQLNQNTVFKFLLYGVLTILTYGSIRFLYDIIFLDARYDYGRAVALLVKYIPHHIYMSMFILISIFATLAGRIEDGANKKSVYILPILYLFLILLGSRMAILLGIIILPLFLFKKMKVQLNILRFIGVALVFGLINLFDERHLLDSFKDPGLYYFIISLILIFMTFKSIKKDQAIINSSNRLR